MYKCISYTQCETRHGAKQTNLRRRNRVLPCMKWLRHFSLSQCRSCIQSTLQSRTWAQLANNNRNLDYMHGETLREWSRPSRTQKPWLIWGVGHPYFSYFVECHLTTALQDLTHPTILFTLHIIIVSLKTELVVE